LKLDSALTVAGLRDISTDSNNVKSKIHFVANNSNIAKHSPYSDVLRSVATQPLKPTTTPFYSPTSTNLSVTSDSLTTPQNYFEQNLYDHSMVDIGTGYLTQV
jgi:hypothetical protein